MLRLVSNSGGSERTAFSFVHARERIDVPVRCVLSIDMSEEFSFFDTEGTFWSYPDHSVEICLACEIRRRLFELTRTIVDQPLDIFVGEDRIVSPVVREPLGANSLPFRIHVHDLAEARALAVRLQRGTVNPDLRIVRTS